VGNRALICCFIVYGKRQKAEGRRQKGKGRRKRARGRRKKEKDGY
jgi:hypothetical protein